MTKLSEEQIRANKEAANRWAKIPSLSSRSIADFFHYAEHYELNSDRFIASARALYTEETTPKKKMVEREIGGLTASFKSSFVYLDNPIPPNIKVRVIYETEEE